jgi:DNA mismatch endonuclease (patch repair protein)
MGYRFRLHSPRLPGKPDIVLPKYRTAMFVHGCFWHRHPDCKYAYNPKSRQSFWERKFQQNVARHQSVAGELAVLGWRVLFIWECEVNNLEALEHILTGAFPKTGHAD